MNEDRKTFWHKPWPLPRWIVTVLKLIAVAYPVALVTMVLTTPPFGAAQWLVAVLIAGGLSVLVAASGFALWKCFRWLCHWRNLRRVLFVAVCAATVVALSYAEEDWRGSHAWNQFRRAAEASGTRLDAASVVPPPVPDDQNFALAPVVASSYGQMIDRTGHEIWPRNTNLVNRLSMGCQAGDSRFDLELYPWTLGKRTDLAALQHYYRTAAAKTNLFPVPPRPQSPAADVLLALSRYDQTIGEVRHAARLPFSRFPLEYDKEQPWNILLPHLAALKCCAQVLSLRATAELQTGQGAQALADIDLQQRLVESVHTEPFLISHLVRLAIVQIMLQPVWEGLADHRWTDPQLAALDAELAAPDFLADYTRSIIGWRAFMGREFDSLRRHPGDYPDLYWNWETSNPVEPNSDRAMACLAACHLVPSGWFYQNQVRAARLLTDYYLPAADRATRVFVPALARQGDAAVEEACRHVSRYNVVECMMLQWEVSFEFTAKFAFGQSSLDLARVAIALERSRLEHGKYPDSLTALAPQFLNQVPHDVIGGQPLHYHLTGDGQFVLYSVGWNETDDGGVVAVKESSPPSQDLARGDWVWRYPGR